MARKNLRNKKHYSNSQIQVFTMCRKKYYFQYIEKIPAFPLYVLESGKALHSGMEENNNNIIEGKKPMTPGQIIDKAVNDFEDNVRDVEGLDVGLEEGVDKLVGDITSPVKQYINVTQPSILEDGIVAAEGAIEGEVAGQPFIGYTDLTTTNMVFDYKLMKRKKSRAQINNDVQLVLYEKFTGKQGTFIEVLRGRKEGIELAIPERNVKTTESILSWAENVIRTIEKCKKSGDFLRCQPTSWVCSTCQFNRFCFNK